MATEPPVVEPDPNNSNGKALAALALGLFATANVVLTVLIFVFWTDRFEDTAIWLLPPFLAAMTGSVAAFLGSLGWIDVRRGVTDRRLLQAKLGTILGGVAAGLVAIAIALTILFFIVMMIAFGADGNGWD